MHYYTEKTIEPKANIVVREMLTRFANLEYNLCLGVGGELDSTEVVRQRLHVEVPPTSINRWNKVNAEPLQVAA